MTRQQRRSKSQWINGLKRRGYLYRGGRIWIAFNWMLRLNIPRHHESGLQIDLWEDYDAE